MREQLVNAIFDYSSDELDLKDAINIAKESEEQLVNRLINILNWYNERFNEL